MPEIIDILTFPKGKDDTFTVNLAVDFVPAAPPAFPNYILENASGRSRFRNGDSFSLLSSGIILPENFTFWKDPANISEPLPRNFLYILGFSGDKYGIDVLGQLDALYLPMENYEVVLDVFVDSTKQVDVTAGPHYGRLLNEDFFLYGNQCLDLISMKNTPLAMAGKTLLISPFYKILHNFPLS